MSSFLGKQDGRAEATEKRPTILLVVGPAEQFPKVMATSRGPPSLGAGLGTFSWKKTEVWEEEKTLKSISLVLGTGEKG